MIGHGRGCGVDGLAIRLRQTDQQIAADAIGGHGGGGRKGQDRAVRICFTAASVRVMRRLPTAARQRPAGCGNFPHSPLTGAGPALDRLHWHSTSLSANKTLQPETPECSHGFQTAARQGLPRVEELFEARKPKGLAIITEIAGVAQIKDTKKKREIVVTNPEDGVSKTYLIPPDPVLRSQTEQFWKPETS